jgi:hypothetical protein
LLNPNKNTIDSLRRLLGPKSTKANQPAKTKMMKNRPSSTTTTKTTSGSSSSSSSYFGNQMKMLLDEDSHRHHRPLPDGPVDASDDSEVSDNEDEECPIEGEDVEGGRRRSNMV